MEKLLTQKDSEIEQLKQMIEDSNQRLKRSIAPNEKPSLYERSNIFKYFTKIYVIYLKHIKFIILLISKGNYENVMPNYNNNNNEIINYQSLDSKKERSITPNTKIEKGEYVVENSREINKIERNFKYQKETLYQENKGESKERTAINFNNSMNSSVK